MVRIMDGRTLLNGAETMWSEYRMHSDVSPETVSLFFERYANEVLACSPRGGT